MKFDKKDGEILEILKQDGRASTVAIAAKTKIPRVTVHDRIEKMRERGIIRKFAAMPNYALLGMGTTSFVLIAYAKSNVTQKELAKKIAAMQYVSEVHILAGEWDLLVKVRGSSIQSTGELVVEKIRKLDGVARTLTIACFESVKEDV